LGTTGPGAVHLLNGPYDAYRAATFAGESWELFGEVLEG